MSYEVALDLLKGEVYNDMCLPFGCVVSCAKFEQFSSFLEWALREKSTLDNVLLAGRSNTTECANFMSCFCSECEDRGVPSVYWKTKGPSSVLTCLGLKVYSCILDMNLNISYDKSQFKSELIFMLRKNKVTLRQLQKLTVFVFVLELYF